MTELDKQVYIFHPITIKYNATPGPTHSPWLCQYTPAINTTVLAQPNTGSLYTAESKLEN